MANALAEVNGGGVGSRRRRGCARAPDIRSESVFGDFLVQAYIVRTPRRLFRALSGWALPAGDFDYSDRFVWAQGKNGIGADAAGGMRWLVLLADPLCRIHSSCVCDERVRYTILRRDAAWSGHRLCLFVPTAVSRHAASFHGSGAGPGHYRCVRTIRGRAAPGVNSTV